MATEPHEHTSPEHRGMLLASLIKWPTTITTLTAGDQCGNADDGPAAWNGAGDSTDIATGWMAVGEYYYVTGPVKYRQRGLIPFSASTIPVGDTVLTAMLRAYLAEIVGTVTTRVGNVQVSLLTADMGTMSAGDYEAAAYWTGFATLATPTSAVGWVEADVTAWVRSELHSLRIQNRSLSFRLCPSASAYDTDYAGCSALARYMFVSSGENAPQLVITHMPQPGV